MLSKMTKKCIQCNKEFQKPYTRSVADFLRRAKYCSKECMNVYRLGKSSFNSGSFQKGHKLSVGHIGLKGEKNPKWKGGKVKLQCYVCKTDYEVLPYRAEKSKTCSLVCFKEYEKTPESRLAKSESMKRRVALGLHNLYRGITELKSLLRQTTHYKQWRKSVFERDDFRCQFCDVLGGELNADHIKIYSLYPELRYDKTNGRTLCLDCHRKTPTWGGLTKLSNQYDVAA